MEDDGFNVIKDLCPKKLCKGLLTEQKSVGVVTNDLLKNSKDELSKEGDDEMSV